MDTQVKKPNVPRFRAKEIYRDIYHEGYYFEMPETTYCFSHDPKPRIIHCLVCYHMTDWGLPNEPYLREIDISTLEEIK